MKSRYPFTVSLVLLSAACGGNPGSTEAASETLADQTDGGVDLALKLTAARAGHPVSRGFPLHPTYGNPHQRDAGSTSTGTTSTEQDAGSKDDAAASADAGSESDDDAGEPRADAGGQHAVDAGGATNPSGFAGLHAVGSKILDANGKTVVLHGVNRSGSEFACVDGYGFFDGPTDAASLQAMKAWNINAVRIPINEDCWLGINGVSAAYSGTNYQQAIEAYVNLIVANGMYAIVDLHWNAPGTTLATGQEAMADADHSPTFWTSAAGVFKSNGSVVLELYNEPWPDNNNDTTAAWTCWRDGGACPSISYEVAGMQTLVTAVRATGATNLLLLGGVQYSNALDQWAAYKPTDSLNNLAAAWHVYNGNLCSDTTCFNKIAAPLAESFPIVATEIGDDGCDGSFVTTIASWLDAHGQSYSAWTWNTWGTTCGNYSLISDYTGTPSGSVGTAYHTYLSGL
jgi:endoglucanase